MAGVPSTYPDPSPERAEITGALLKAIPSATPASFSFIGKGQLDIVVEYVDDTVALSDLVVNSDHLVRSVSSLSLPLSVYALRARRMM